ncbi:MAG: Nif3-like dinuclear metal center hexameric protein [Fimbriimonadaceae bacterium]|nr:Nif3-like dinuclear metal center hexameric protein [Chitinophagales bacterium]
MQISEVIEFLETIAPASLQQSYDNAGLIVGNKNETLSGILICLDSTEQIIEEAIQNNCNLIIAHHPIIFSGLKKITGANYIERTIISAIKNNIAIYAIHTNLDNVYEGVNKMIADKLELRNCKILQPGKGHLKKLVTFAPHANAAQIREVLFNAGGGHIGNYDHCSFNLEGAGTFRGDETTNPHVGEKNKEHHEPETRIEMIFPAWLEKQLLNTLIKNHPYEEVAYDIYPLDNVHQNIGAGIIGNTAGPIEEKEFLQFLKLRMQVEVVRFTTLLNKPIEKVAVCGGSGSFLLKDAIAAGADIFITADFKYHQFFDADGKIIIADIGHYESEQFTVDLITWWLREKFPNFAAHIKMGQNTNPVKYL